MTNLKPTIKERIWNAYAAGYNDARNGRERDIAVYAEEESVKLLEAVERHLLTKEGMSMAVLLGYEAGKEATST